MTNGLVVVVYADERWWTIMYQMVMSEINMLFVNKGVFEPFRVVVL